MARTPSRGLRRLGVYRAGGFDVLFPTQEQVAVLAAVQPPVVTAVPAFGALARVQDKISPMPCST